MDFDSPPTDASEIFRGLTPSQHEAVSHIDGPMLILAGPGSGKTRVVTHRIANLIHEGIPARQILALTFTNKAADEMRLRLDRLAPREPVWMGTFHRFCARLLRQHASLVGLNENYSIYDSADSKRLIADVIRQSRTELTHVTADQIARGISWAKSNLLEPDQYLPEMDRTHGAAVNEIYPLYQQRLLAANAVDFDDLLLHVATLLRENAELREVLDDRYRYILVDEYQDTNFVQYAIVRALSQNHPNLAVTGDPDQSIYGWRGANLQNILDFEHDFEKVRVIRLEQNYRSTQSILRVADHLISNNTKRKKKRLYTENPEGDPVRLVVYPSSRDESEHIATRIADDISHGRRRPRDFAIFYRVNSLSRGLEKELRTAGVPYQVIKGVEFYQRKEIKDVLAYCQLINNPQSDAAFLRIINTPPRKIGKTTIQRLTDHAHRYRISLFDAAREGQMIESMNKRSLKAVNGFVELIDRLSALAAEPVEMIIGHVLSETGYEDWLEASDAEQDEDRAGNVQELLSDAREFDMEHPDACYLEEFLEWVALVNDTDDWENEVDKVSLMTLHAAKGLEFPVVYIIAVEQGLLPHERSADDPDQFEEERRLLFVGITRAEESLQLSLGTYRFLRGGQRRTIPSPFLVELPRDEMEVYEPKVSPYASAMPPSEDEYNQDLNEYEEFEVYHDANPAPAASQTAAVVTAAELLGEVAPRRKVSPDLFHHGMIVTHPEFGTGKIVAVSGEGAKRSAKVRFFNSTRDRSFFLIHSDLQPVGSPE